jgi:hypothetical protein
VAHLWFPVTSTGSRGTSRRISCPTTSGLGRDLFSRAASESWQGQPDGALPASRLQSLKAFGAVYQKIAQTPDVIMIVRGGDGPMKFSERSSPMEAHCPKIPIPNRCASHLLCHGRQEDDACRLRLIDWAGGVAHAFPGAHRPGSAIPGFLFRS